MKKTLLFTKKFYTVYTLLVFVLCFNYGWSQSQQVIGQFPFMDGGLEAQNATTSVPSGSSTNAPNFNFWTISSTSAAGSRIIAKNASNARSGLTYGVVALAATATATNVRLQVPASPATNILENGTAYVVQFYYKASVDPSTSGNSGASVVTGAIYVRGTVSGTAVNVQSTTAHVANTWVKYSEIITTTEAAAGVASATAANPGNFACVRLAADANVFTSAIDVDDFVVYAGSAPDTDAPNAATAGTYTTGGVVSWTAPAGGVDGGGYVVVKYTADPGAGNNPNQNGIYQVGNTVGTGTVAYIGTATTFTDTYVAGNFYKIYAVDKAFNYSSGITISDATLSLTKNTIQGLEIYPNPAKDNINIKTDNVKISSIELYNVLGAKVLSQKVLTNNQLNVSNLAKGIYILKVNAEGASTTKKIVIE